jgi:phytoene dehydrogenase-like protein
MLTPIEGLYLAGHNNRAGGMPMALMSGFMTANRIIEK